MRAFEAARSKRLPAAVSVSVNGSSSPFLDRWTGPKLKPVMPASIKRRTTRLDTITSLAHVWAISAVFGVSVRLSRKREVWTRPCSAKRTDFAIVVCGAAFLSCWADVGLNVQKA